MFAWRSYINVALTRRKVVPIVIGTALIGSGLLLGHYAELSRYLALLLDAPDGAHYWTSLFFQASAIMVIALGFTVIATRPSWRVAIITIALFNINIVAYDTERVIAANTTHPFAKHSSSDEVVARLKVEDVDRRLIRVAVDELNYGPPIVNWGATVHQFHPKNRWGTPTLLEWSDATREHAQKSLDRIKQRALALPVERQIQRTLDDIRKEAEKQP